MVVITGHQGMSDDNSKNTLIVIEGPTAVGKTAFAVALAKMLNTSVISADSRQFYKELKIGTAKPSVEEMEGVHHLLLGHLSIHDYYNVSRFEQEVLTLLPVLFAENQYVILAGGSGLYIDAVCNGIDDFPDPDPELRSYLKGLLRDEGIEKLQNLLFKHDPEYYRSVDLMNPVRLQRALEVVLSTGKPYSELRAGQPKVRDFNIVKIGLNLPREVLFARIARRVDKMMDDGLLEEVRSLLPFRHLTALNTVGYKELFDYLDGNITLPQAVENIKTNTRRYAKRQLTWLRRDPEVKWVEPDHVQELQAYLADQ
ncbi:MAG TPA: tRNA (adenosine(37)-N6)-dimethylallyltransferase MiaA [Bacteroidales bacterium]|nr:tRNA (adenosine(37)-N6)-dimethylallyltransferase MiaA [Bacteroidales bacterium]